MSLWCLCSLVTESMCKKLLGKQIACRSLLQEGLSAGVRKSHDLTRPIWNSVAVLRKNILATERVPQTFNKLIPDINQLYQCFGMTDI